MAFEKTCERCHKVFSTKYKKARFCSRECVKRHILEKICENCGTKYKTKQEKSRFCSKKCIYEEQKRPYKICPTCNKQHRNRWKCCSRECFVADCKKRKFWLLAKNPGRPKSAIEPVEKQCYVCGIRFISRNKYCCKECADRAKSYYAAHRLKLVSFGIEKSKYIPYCFIRQTPVECECCGKLHTKPGKTCSKRCFIKLVTSLNVRYWENKKFYAMSQDEFAINIPDISGIDFFENYMTDFSDFS